jgi:nucleoside phosphorylase
VVVGSESIYCDVLDSNSTLPRVAHLTPSPALVDAARTALPGAVIAPIATAARVGGGAGYPVEATEGFGVLRAAAASGVPAVEIRVISNDPGAPSHRL